MGKSTLMRVLTAELAPRGGRSQVPGRVGYVRHREGTTLIPEAGRNREVKLPRVGLRVQDLGHDRLLATDGRRLVALDLEGRGVEVLYEPLEVRP